MTYLALSTNSSSNLSGGFSENNAGSNSMSRDYTFFAWLYASITGKKGPAGTVDFVLFHSAMLEINFCAWLHYTEPTDMHIFL
jgi:hypothetical protein